MHEGHLDPVFHCKYPGRVRVFCWFYSFPSGKTLIWKRSPPSCPGGVIEYFFFPLLVLHGSSATQRKRFLSSHLPQQFMVSAIHIILPFTSTWNLKNTLANILFTVAISRMPWNLYNKYKWLLPTNILSSNWNDRAYILDGDRRLE